MKILYKSMYSALLMGAMGLNATAQQQLPNSGFEEEWVNCVPWTSTNNTTAANQEINGTKVTGQQPNGWCISDVIGMSGIGSTVVGFKAEGYNSGAAVQLKNSANPIMDSQKVPAYINLGKSWSTAVSKFSFSGISVTNSDGGSFSGKDFTERPTGLEFMYKRSRGTEKPDEKSTVVAYLWKGLSMQNDVPGNIIMGTPTKIKMNNRDRCVLGMSLDGCQGGEVNPDNAELIASINESITENATEWTPFSAKFDYKSDAMPDSINVIIAAGDYFGGADVVGKDNELIVDNVRLFYEYTDNLSIKMGTEATDEDAIKSEATIKIVPNGDGTCTFTLPNFTLKAEDSEIPVGDIVVENVQITENDGVYTYNGTVDKLELLGGAIKAQVKLSGTVEYMKIDVIWLMTNEDDPSDPDNMPIFVEFGQKPNGPSTGIADINVDNSNAPVEFYNLQGIRVNADNLVPGIYVRRQGSAVSKVLVK